MRQSVPFIGEELITRNSGGDESTKTAKGRLIGELLSTQGERSSWEELVPERSRRAEYSPKVDALPTTPTPQKRNQIISNPGSVGTQQAHIDWIPINNGRGMRITISGRLDLQLRREWQKFIQAAGTSDIGQYEFNLTQTPELSLTGLGLLLLFKEQKKSQRQDIKLCHCNRQVWQLLQWAGMDEYFLIQGKAGGNISRK